MSEDPWNEHVPLTPWRQEPSGPDVALMLRIASSSGHTNGQALWHSDMKAVDEGFKWPEHGYMRAFCGGPFWGFRGFLDGVGDVTMLPRHKDAIWQVVKVIRSECKPDPLGGAVRAPRCWVIYSGDAVGALKIILPHIARNSYLMDMWSDDEVATTEPARIVHGSHSSVASWDQAHSASLGVGGNALTVGHHRYAMSIAGHASAGGWFGCAVNLRGGVASARNMFGDAIARRSVRNSTSEGIETHQAFAEAGSFGTAIALGPNGVARAGWGGAIVLAEYVDEGAGVQKMVGIKSVMVGEEGTWPNKWYTLQGGRFVRAEGP